MLEVSIAVVQLAAEAFTGSTCGWLRGGASARPRPLVSATRLRPTETDLRKLLTILSADLADSLDSYLSCIEVLDWNVYRREDSAVTEICLFSSGSN